MSALFEADDFPNLFLYDPKRYFSSLALSKVDYLRLHRVLWLGISVIAPFSNHYYFSPQSGGPSRPPQRSSILHNLFKNY
jgi:hypothetical protein